MCVRFAENAPFEHGNSKRLKVARSAHPDIGLVIPVTSRKLETAITVAAGQGQSAYRGGKLHARQRLQLFNYLVIELILLSETTCRRKTNVENQQMTGIEARIYVHEFYETLHQQP